MPVCWYRNRTKRINDLWDLSSIHRQGIKGPLIQMSNFQDKKIELVFPSALGVHYNFRDHSPLPTTQYSQGSSSGHRKGKPSSHFNSCCCTFSSPTTNHKLKGTVLYNDDDGFLRWRKKDTLSYYCSSPFKLSLKTPPPPHHHQKNK